MVPELDPWLPHPTLRVNHDRESSAPPQALWDAAAALRLDQVPVLGRLVQWRIPGTRHDASFEALLSEAPFLVLERSARLLVSGLVGRIWTPRRDYPRLGGPEEYREWSRGGTARVGIAVSVLARDSGSVIRTDARVQALGVQGRIGVAALRPIVLTFEHLLGSEALRAAAHAAESKSRESRPRGGEDRTAEDSGKGARR